MDPKDEELRHQLSNYMDSVPPVTEKLQKTQSIIAPNAISKSIIPDELSPSVPKSRQKPLNTFTKSVSPANSAPINKDKPVENISNRVSISPQTATGDASTSGDNSSSSFLYEDNQYRVRRFPATELPDYPGGIPIFRRRSLHPEGAKPSNKNDGLPDPYEEFVIRSPRIQAQADAHKIISRVMSGRSDYRSYEGIRSKRAPHLHKQAIRNWSFRLPNFQPIFDCLASALFGLFGLIWLPFKAFIATGRRISGALNCKLLVIFAMICALIGTAIFFFLSDPFYHNPVSEFAERMSEPLASILHSK